MSIRKRTDGEYSAHLQGTLDLLILRTLIFGKPARTGDRPRHPDPIRQRAHRRARVALPCPSAARGARFHRRRLGHFREQPEGAVLFADAHGAQRAGARTGRVAARRRARSCACSDPSRKRPDFQLPAVQLPASRFLPLTTCRAPAGSRKRKLEADSLTRRRSRPPSGGSNGTRESDAGTARSRRGPEPALLTAGARPTFRLSSPAGSPPAAAPTSALVHTFRSLLIASSNAWSPRNTPAPNPAPMPTSVQTTRLVVELSLWRGADWRLPASADNRHVERAAGRSRQDSTLCGTFSCPPLKGRAPYFGRRRRATDGLTRGPRHADARAAS